MQGQSEQAPGVDTRMFNMLVRDIRALGEGAAELEQRRRSLQYLTLTLSPRRLVLNRIWK
ncbi:hypothetical protein [Streptomyces sp. 7N604]|uniref:hypothetical protein n=1 Tax=Streptomyces sp. 7N604 TaxID=3457415 RepID=UPI003FD1A3B9